MRLVLALIQPTKLKAVQEALANVGVERMTVCVVCAPQVTTTLVMFAVPTMPVPLVTVQRSLASTTWTL